MKRNLLNQILGREEKKPPVLLAITPPRNGDRTLLGVENTLQSIAVPEPFSLELAGDEDGVTLLARCLEDRVVRQQLGSHYPQAQIRRVDPAEDPLRLHEGEQAWGMTLRASGPEYVPLRTFKDDDLLDPGSDPLIALLGALSNLRSGERVVSRLTLRSMGPDWSQRHQQMLERKKQPDPNASPHYAQAQATRTDVGHLAALGVLALPALQGYLWWQRGETWKAVLLGIGMAAALALAGWGYWRWKKARNRVFDPLIIREKVSRIAFDGEVQVTAILPEDASPQRARELLEPVAAAYKHYDHPAGARFKVSRIRPVLPSTHLEPRGPGLFGKRSVLGVREAAALWHPPGERDETPLLDRSGSRSLLPSARGVRGGALVGRTTVGNAREIHFPDDLLRRHHLYVARTRMGKSTLMGHIITHKLREKAAGRDHDAIVVVDPHADMVKELLERVPPSLVDQVKLIDLADERGAPGINLLDTRVFANRDRTADSVVRVMHGLWEQWGPRMQSILEHVVKSLHEANERVEADKQYTILDGSMLVTDRKFRSEVMALVDDPFLLRWWAKDFLNLQRERRAEAVAPVQTRLSYYASSKKARAILGQPRSTINLRETILDGGILFVSTAQGAVGRDVSALVGASLLNLVDSTLREQERLPMERRRGALVVVDEMQALPGVDYESMLSELGKYGASFILATQSLAKLNDLSLTMRDTILANVGCLAAFQTAGNDARQLVYELGRDRVTEEDIVSLDVHHCYVRATVGTQRMPAFSMALLPPEEGDPAVAQRIQDDALAYLSPSDLGEAMLRRRVAEYRRILGGSGEEGDPQPEPQEDDDGDYGDDDLDTGMEVVA